MGCSTRLSEQDGIIIRNASGNTVPNYKFAVQKIAIQIVQLQVYLRIPFVGSRGSCRRGRRMYAL